MTHSLHRLGNLSQNNLEFIVLTFGHSRGSQSVFGSKKAVLKKKMPKLYKYAKNVYEFLKINRIIKSIKDLKNREKYVGPYVTQTKEELYQCLKKMKRAKNGRSVVVSGKIDEIEDCLRRLNLRMHTVQYSLGYFGKIELLPDKKILEMTTMCGHHMISPELVKKLAGDIKRGRLTSQEATTSMEKLCVCKIFNRNRAMEIFDRIVKSED